MRLSVDSNLLVYLLDARDPTRQRSAVTILAALGTCDAVLTLQARAEFFHVVVRKQMASVETATAHLADFRRLFPTPAGATEASFDRARRAWLARRFSFWDAMLLAAAGAAGCTTLISEDMHDGAELDGVRVVAAFDPNGAVSAAARAVLGLA